MMIYPLVDDYESTYSVLSTQYITRMPIRTAVLSTRRLDYTGNVYYDVVLCNAIRSTGTSTCNHKVLASKARLRRTSRY